MPAQPGRPRGSRTVRRLPVVAVPPLCPACGYTLTHPGRMVRVRPLPSGRAPNGQPANRLYVRFLTCPCGQPLAVREYRLDPPQP